MSTAFLASRPAPSMTDGFDVLVQLVIDAIVTMPWSRIMSPRSVDDTLTGFDGRPAAPLLALWAGS
ncbi:Uncharacterised protein [Mycobacteroides abscessus subsp. abscessus]|nr:Uncharacterised protein [Mycobacteroides abscessus subsp. abscessus]